MINGETCLFTFPSTFFALKAEKVLQAAGLKIRLIPVPRELSSLCGLALELDCPESVEAISALRNNSVELEKKVVLTREKGRIKDVQVVADFGDGEAPSP